MKILRNKLNDYDKCKGMALQDVRKCGDIELVQKCENVYLFRIGLDEFLTIKL